MGWTAEEAKALAQSILAYSKSDECEVACEQTESAHTRFAASEVTTSGTTRDLSIAITSRSKGRSGTTRINETEPDTLKKAVAISEDLMAVAPADPEFVESL